MGLEATKTIEPRGQREQFPQLKVKLPRTALETKGAHLIGNDDTAYKQRLFDLLTSHLAKAQEAGRVLTREGQPMTFKLVLDQSWQPDIQALLAA